MGYSLDGQNNLTLTETTLNLTELVNGSHTLTSTKQTRQATLQHQKQSGFTITKDDETPTTLTTTVTSIASVAAAIVATITLHFTKTKKTAQKNENLLGS